MAPNKSMSDEHKAALAEGREQGRAVRRYLEALEANKPRRGRKRTEASVRNRLETVDAKLAEADPVDRLLLTQERLDLTEELEAMQQKVDLAELEAAFIGAAKPYGERKGISYAAWREVGVPADVLRRAGISRRN